MNYCSLNDAFPSTEGVPSPGCKDHASLFEGSSYLPMAKDQQAAKAARKEERRKMKRCKPQGQSVDPDRQQYGKLPDVPAMNATDMGMDSKAWATQEFHSFADDVNDPFEPLVPIPTPSIASTTMIQNDASPSVPKKKGYFGQDPEDHYADYMPAQTDYRLEPDFLGTFEQMGVEKAAGKSLLPPAANMYWKPTTRSGAQTAFMESLPPQKYHKPMEMNRGDPTVQELMKRMDVLFARLDELNATTPEQMTSELLMFISSGIFVLFMMDLLVKKGSKMRF
jgi:hypothetical protein